MQKELQKPTYRQETQEENKRCNRYVNIGVGKRNKKVIKYCEATC